MISALPVAGAGAERPYSDAGVDRHRRADYGVWELAPALERGGQAAAIQNRRPATAFPTRLKFSTLSFSFGRSGLLAGGRRAPQAVGDDANISEVPGLIKRADANPPARECAVLDREQRLLLTIHKNLDAAAGSVAGDADCVPRAVGKSRSGLQPRDALSWAPVDNKYPVMNRVFGATVNRQVCVIEMERIHITENHNHGSPYAPDMRFELEAPEGPDIRERELQRAARDARLAAALHVEIVEWPLAQNFPILRMRKLPGVEVPGREILAKRLRRSRWVRPGQGPKGACRAGHGNENWP